MSEIGKLIQAYQDKHGTSDRALALRVGVTATLVGRWKRGLFVELPKPEKIRGLAELIGPRPTEEEILDAFLADTGYLREDVMEHADRSAPNQTPDTDPADQSVTTYEEPTKLTPRKGGKGNSTATNPVTPMSDESSTVEAPPLRVAKRPTPRKRKE